MRFPCPHCGERIEVASDPEGVTLEDGATKELRHKEVYLVLDHGQWRTLVLRVGRGILRDANEQERSAARAALGRMGGLASAAKLTGEQRSEKARHAALSRRRGARK